MLRTSLLESLRPGWCRRRFRVTGLLARLLVLAFVFHVSGIANFVSDMLLEDDMTCADELAHKSQDGSTAPRCPASQGVGHGQGVTPAESALMPIAPAAPERVGCAGGVEIEPWAPPAQSIERPPRA